MDEAKTYIGVLDNFGAIGILALLIYRLPSILQIINDGKKEMAVFLAESQKQSSTSFKEALVSLENAFSERYAKLYTNQEKMQDLLTTQNKALEGLIIRLSLEKK